MSVLSNLTYTVGCVMGVALAVFLVGLGFVFFGYCFELGRAAARKEESDPADLY